MPRRNNHKNASQYTLDVQSLEHQLHMENKKELWQKSLSDLKEKAEKEEIISEEVVLEKAIEPIVEKPIERIIEPVEEKEQTATPIQDYTKSDIHCDFLNEAEKIVDRINKLFNSLEIDFDYIEKTISSCQDEQNDLLHEIELSKTSSLDRIVFLYDELHKCRTKRRNYKDLREKITPINNFYKKNKGILQQLVSIKKEMEKIRRNKQNPVYSPRVRKDLTI